MIIIMLCHMSHHVTLVHHHWNNEPHSAYNCISDISFKHPLLSKLLFTSNKVMEGHSFTLVNYARFGSLSFQENVLEKFWTGILNMIMTLSGPRVVQWDISYQFQLAEGLTDFVIAMEQHKTIRDWCLQTWTEPVISLTVTAWWVWCFVPWWCLDDTTQYNSII